MSSIKFNYSQTCFLVISFMLCHLIVTSSSPEIGGDSGTNSHAEQSSNGNKGPKDLKKGLFKKFLEFPDNRDVIVHLHDWPYEEIKKECPSLREIGYAAVQISPVTTYAHFDNHPWDERLSVINYDFENESGNEKELASMIKVCNKNNVKVFVDVVINNMARSTDANDKGEKFEKMEYKSKNGIVLFTKSDFHESCDLNSNDYQQKIVNYYDENSNTDSGQAEVQNNQGASIKQQYINKIKSLENILEFYKSKRNKKEFDITSSLIDHTKKQVLWTCMAYDRHDLKLVDEDNKPKKQIIDLLQHLVYLGVSGFRILLADHMNPDHLHKIYDWLPQKPLFIYHDVYDPMRHENNERLVHTDEYALQTRVTDYKYARLLSRTFLTTKMTVGKIFRLQEELDLLPSEDSVVFVNNFITLGLGNGGIGFPVLEDQFIYPTYEMGKKAVMLATSFMLIHDHGVPLITSSYSRKSGEKEYVKEHAWSTIKYMVQFRNILKKHNQGTIPPPDKYREYSWAQSSYCVGSTGFVAYNNENPEKELKKTVDTCFESDGEYCDIFGGGLNSGDDAGVKPCTGNSMVVSQGGKKGELKMAPKEGLAAFHIDAMVPFRNS